MTAVTMTTARATTSTVIKTTALNKHEMALLGDTIGIWKLEVCHDHLPGTFIALRWKIKTEQRSHPEL